MLTRVGQYLCEFCYKSSLRNWVNTFWIGLCDNPYHCVNLATRTALVWSNLGHIVYSMDCKMIVLQVRMRPWSRGERGLRQQRETRSSQSLLGLQLRKGEITPSPTYISHLPPAPSIWRKLPVYRDFSGTGWGKACNLQNGSSGKSKEA